MSKNRKTGKDYRKDLNDITQKRNALEHRIINRALELGRVFPDAVIGKETISFTPKEFTARMFLDRKQHLDVDDALYLIEGIEKYNEEHSRITQKKIDGFN